MMSDQERNDHSWGNAKICWEDSSIESLDTAISDYTPIGTLHGEIDFTATGTNLDLSPSNDF
jgi:hypothetical protein